MLLRRVLAGSVARPSVGIGFKKRLDCLRLAALRFLESALPSIHKHIPAQFSIPKASWSRLISQSVRLEVL
jgi:hypothetical protein